MCQSYSANRCTYTIMIPFLILKVMLVSSNIMFYLLEDLVEWPTALSPADTVLPHIFFHAAMSYINYKEQKLMQIVDLGSDAGTGHVQTIVLAKSNTIYNYFE